MLYYPQLIQERRFVVKNHIRLAFWSIQILWKLKGIWPMDKFKLWKKSIRLYLSFLAFTDSEHPVSQLRNAMLCAILSAVYDYDTDWTFGNRQGENFFALLPRVESTEARMLATELFHADIQRKVSGDGLERGSIALHFYWLVINSAWMHSYVPEQIHSFGRKLQIVDDLLDVEEDRISGDTNCFLLKERIQEFVTEIEEFLGSNFFGKLKDHSKVYATLEDKMQKKLQNFGTRPATLKQLFATGRPHTGLYAFALSLIGFGFYEGTPWIVILLTALAYAGLTMSIMTFNDWIDRENDRKKGKLFASEHSQELIRYWRRLSGVTLMLMLMIIWWNTPLAIFSALVWTIGILYSYTRRWYLLNNAIVAICAGSPALCGMIYHGEIRWIAICTASIFVILIFINELWKDAKDRETDYGYKVTMPTKKGSVLTLWQTIVFTYAPTILFVFYPNPWVRWYGIAMMSFVAFQQAAAFLHPKLINRPLSSMQLILGGLLIVLLLT